MKKLLKMFFFVIIIVFAVTRAEKFAADAKAKSISAQIAAEETIPDKPSAENAPMDEFAEFSDDGAYLGQYGVVYNSANGGEIQQSADGKVTSEGPLNIGMPIIEPTETPPTVIVGNVETVAIPAPTPEMTVEVIGDMTVYPIVDETPPPDVLPDEPTVSVPPPVIDAATLSNKKLAWAYAATNSGSRPKAYTEFDVSVYGGYYLGTDEKTIYLTFDEGYENGCTEQILDTLKAKGVKATFFVTQPFLEGNPSIVRRIADEGHAVCSHSIRHLSSPDLTDDELIEEILTPARYYRELTGKEMIQAFRPPMGEYSERTLYVTQSLGWKSVFWSFAHRDWLTDNQPSAADAYAKIIGGLHNGAILLLHAVSSANTEVLPDVIDFCFEKRYNFKTIESLN